MGRLNELIANLCPKGVEFQKIGDVLIPKSAPRKLNKKEYKDEGLYPIIDQGQRYIVGYTNDNTSVIPKGKYIIFGEHTRYVKFIDFSFAQGADGVKILKPAGNHLDPKYLYFAFNNLNIPSRGYNRHWIVAKKLEIPIPPLTVQQEIVRILDQYTAAEEKLEAKLRAELDARTKQFEYYREKLLIINNLTELKSLGGKDGVCEVVPSGVDKVINEGERLVKICNYLDVYNNKYINSELVSDFMDGGVNESEYQKFRLRKGQILITKDSETKEDIAQSVFVCNDFDDVVCGYHLAILIPKININGKYLNYILQSKTLRNYFSRMSNGVSRFGLKLKVIEEAKIPIIPMGEQERIVSILDRYDMLVNDLRERLQSEKEALRKQYEYYRDQLLTFKELQA